MDHTSDRIPPQAWVTGVPARERLLAWLRARFPVRIVLDALLLSLLTAAVFAVAYQVFVRMFSDPRSDAYTGFIAAELGGLAEARARLPAADRDAFLDAVAAASRGRLARDELSSRATRVHVDGLKDQGLVADIFQGLVERFPPGRVAMTRDDAGLHLWFAMPNERGGLDWVRLPAERDRTGWSPVSLQTLGQLVAAVGAFGATYLAWRLRGRIGRMERALQGLRPDAVRAGPVPAPPSDLAAADPQRHLQALASRLARAARERAVFAGVVAGDLRRQLAQVAGLMAQRPTPQAEPRFQRLQGLLAQLDRFAAGSSGQGAPGGGAPTDSRWRGLLADLAMVAGLYAGAIALSAWVVSQAIFAPRILLGFAMLETVVAGIHATHGALPASHREDYLRSLQRHSGGSMRLDDPSNWPIAAPRVQAFQQGLERMRAASPGLELRTTPMPHSFLWVRMDSAEGPVRWVRLSMPVLRSFHWPPLAGLALLALGVAAIVVLQAQRRLAWFTRTIDTVDADETSWPKAEEGQAPEVGLIGLVRGFRDAAGELERAHDREELALARLGDELVTALEDLRAVVPHAAGASAEADCLDAMCRLAAELDGFARRRRSAEEASSDLNAELYALDALMADRGAPPVLWRLGGVPLADIPAPELRRLFLCLFDEIERHGDAPIVVSTRLEACCVVLEVAGHGHGPAVQPPSGDPVSLAVAGRIAAASGGCLRLQPGSDGGLRGQVWLRPARMG